MVDGKIVAPRDSNPLKYNGPEGMWAEHVSTVKAGGIPTGLDGWYGFTQPVKNLPNTGREGFKAFIQEFIYVVDNNKINIPDNPVEVIGEFIDLLLSIESGNNENKSIVQDMIVTLKNDIPAEEDADLILASLGSRFLNFKTDSTGVVHSQYNTWQIPGGYNNAYDAIFSYATHDNMNVEKFDFKVGTMEYILWAWNGDYLNIGAGCEVGFYSRDESEQSFGELDHYRVDQNLAVHMQLYLYNYYGDSNIENILSYQPTEPQWWITGFNQEHAGIVDVDKEVMVACVDFSKFTFEYKNDMYDMFKDQITGDDSLKDFVLFDDDKQTIWILMYKGSLK